jgi:hypothetical protein
MFIHPVRFRLPLRAGFFFESLRFLVRLFQTLGGCLSAQGDGVFAETHLFEEAEAEPHECGVVGEQLLHFFSGTIVAFGKAVADHEFAEAVRVVTGLEKQLQAALCNESLSKDGAGSRARRGQPLSDWIIASPFII